MNPLITSLGDQDPLELGESAGGVVHSSLTRMPPKLRSPTDPAMFRTLDRRTRHGIGLRRAGAILAFAAAYIAAARLGLTLALPPEKKASAVWIPSGLAFAALLLLGRWVWPGVWLGAFLANFWDYFVSTNSLPLSSHLWVSAGIAVGSTLQALAGSHLIRRLVGSAHPFDHPSHAFIFAAVAMVVCVIAATCGAACLYGGGFAPSHVLGFVWWTWWLGDVTGVLTAGSLLLIWSRPPRVAWTVDRCAEAVLLLAILMILGSVVFGIAPVPTPVPPPLAYLVIPFLVWATFRFGQHGASAALVITSGLAVFGTAHGVGSFVQPTVPGSLLLLQVFMGVLAVTVLVMAAVLSESQASRNALLNARRTVAAMLENMPDACCGLDRNWRYTYVNAQWEALFGRSAVSAIGNVIWRDFPGLIGTAVETNYMRVMRERTPITFEFQSAYAKLWLEVRAYPTDDGIGAHIRDISARRQAEAELRQSEQRYDLAVRGSNDGVWDWNLRTHQNYFSDRCLEMWGFNSRELVELYETWVDRLHPEDRDRVTAAVDSHLEKRTPYDEEYRFLTKNGEWRWFRSRGQAVWDEFGKPLRMAGSVTDVTDRRAHEERVLRFNEELEAQVIERARQLKESERRFRAIFHSQFQFIGLMCPKGILLEANRAALAAAGVTEESVLGKPFWETAWWTHDLVQQGRLRHAVERAAAGERSRFEASHPAAGGGLIWVDFSLTPFFDDSGEVVLLIPEGRDITERKRTEEALRLQKERFRSAFDNAPIGLALVAPDGRWLRVNESLCRIVGYSEVELLATTFQAITYPDDLEADLGHIRDLLSGTIMNYQMNKRYFHKNGHLVHIFLAVSLVRGSAGQPLHFIKQIQDITHWKEAEERIKTSLQEKEVLLKEIHHRVKNNLQIVSTLLDLQSDHTQDPSALEMFRASRGRVKSMALIHERLYRSQDLAHVNFAEYVRRLAEDLYHTYKTSGDEIELHVEVTAPPLSIDIAIPCGLLLNELISNSLKHGFASDAEGWIRVTLRRRGSNNILIVADNGAGFPPNFDFRDTASFGLQLVNTLVEQLHGEVELNAGDGSEFVVTFPVKDNDNSKSHR